MGGGYRGLLRAQPAGSLFIATADEITFTVNLVTRCGQARAFVRHPSLLGIACDLDGAEVVQASGTRVRADAADRQFEVLRSGQPVADD